MNQLSSQEGPARTSFFSMAANPARECDEQTIPAHRPMVPLPCFESGEQTTGRVFDNPVFACLEIRDVLCGLSWLRRSFSLSGVRCQVFVVRCSLSGVRCQVFVVRKLQTLRLTGDFRSTHLTAGSWPSEVQVGIAQGGILYSQVLTGQRCPPRWRFELVGRTVSNCRSG